MIIKALRITRNIKHAGFRAVIKYFFSYQSLYRVDSFVLRIPARFYIAKRYWAFNRDSIQPYQSIYEFLLLQNISIIVGIHARYQQC